MTVISTWFHDLYRDTGINFTIFYDRYDGTRFGRGILLTLELSLITVVASTLVGLIGATLQGTRSTLVRWAVAAYVQLFRNTPPLVQLYFFYFGLSTITSFSRNSFGAGQPLISGFVWACISLTLYAGSFNVEIFRSGIEAVPKATVEAAESLGYTRLQISHYILIPLAIRVCLPSLTNNLVNLVKTTSLAYAIAVPELLYASAQIWSDTGNVPEMMVAILIVYFSIVGLLAFMMRLLERALRRPGLGT